MNEVEYDMNCASVIKVSLVMVTWRCSQDKLQKRDGRGVVKEL